MIWIALSMTLLAAAPRTPVPALARILVERDGVVAVQGADLARAGFPVAAEDVPRLRLRNRGVEVPVLIRGRGASFEMSFLARFLRGEQSYEDPYSKTNVYLLDLAPAGVAPARLPIRDAPAPPLQATRWTSSSYTAHFESNRKLVRFTSTPPPDTWFWEEVKATDPGPTEVEFALDRAAPGRPFRLKLGMMGYSSLPAEPDHTVDVAFDSTPIGQAVWDGDKPIVWETTVLGTLKEGANRLSVQARGENTNGIDLVLLDWIEVTYARENHLDPDGQAPLQVGGGAVAELPAEGELLLYEARHAGVWRTVARDGLARVALPGAARGVRAVSRPLAPKAITVARPAELSRGAADLLIVTHPSLQPAAERLAAFRRKQGLAVQVVRVDDIYDRFSHGILNPEAIRDFLRHAHQHWTPRPRYVLLFGDASWDYKNLLALDENYADWHWQAGAEGGFEVPKNVSTPYQQGPLANERNLVPTFQWQSPWGHAASDNHFAQLEGDDEKPDVALGRIAVFTLAEAQGVVDKLIAYERKGGSRQALFISDPYESHKIQTDELVVAAEEKGYQATKLYAQAEDNESGGNARTILDAFDSGEAIVTFAGHGGRYIWRTGPPDPKTNHDLFTMDHLDQLKAGAPLPVVISLTCYSAPFDHPAADSIGEKLIRMPDRGAIAVVASSWRNAPPFDLARRMIERLGQQDAPRIGDAFVSAMRDSSDPMTLNTYNLLGDPSTLYRGPSLPNGGDDARKPKR